MSETRQLRVVIAGDAAGARAAVRALSQGLDETDARVRRASGVWDSFAGKLAGIGVMAAGGLAVAGAGIAALGIKTAANFEQLEVSFGTLLKSNDKAKTEMAWLKEKAAATPFELSDLANADRTLLGFGFKVDETRKNFLLSMGDMAAAVGLPSSALPDLSRIFGQVHAAGVVGMEDINQLIDNGVPIWDMLTAATGKSVKTLREEIEARKLSADTFESATQTYTKNNFAGAMDKQSQTLTGLWSSLKDNVSIAAAEMVKPLVPLIKEWMPKFAEGAKKAGEWITTDLVPAVTSAVDWVKKIVDFIDKFTVGIGPLGAMIGAAAGAIVIVVAAMRTWAAIQAIMNLLMAANPIGIVIVAIAALAAGIAYLWTHNETFRKIVIAVWNAVKNAFKATVDWIGGALKWLGDFFSSIWNGIVSVVSTVVSWVVGFVVGYFTTLFSFWSAIWNGIATAVSAVWDWIKSAVSTAVAWVVAFVTLYINTLSAVWSAIWNGISEAAASVWGWIKNTISAGVAYVRNTISGALDAVKSAWSSAWNAVSNFVSNAWGWIKNSVSNGIGGMLNVVRSIPGKIMGAIGNLGSLLYDSGTKIIQGLIDGIKNMAGNVKDAVSGVLKKARDLLPFSPAKEGPFSGKGWTLYSGQSISESLAEGITSKGDRVGLAMKAVMTDAHPNTGTAGSLATASLGTATATANGGVNVTVHVQGSVTAERDLVKAISLGVRDEIARNGKRNGGKTGLGGRIAR